VPQVARVARPTARATTTPVREELAATSEAHSPLVGRKDSLEQLMAAVARARQGQGGLCVISGEAGIGKTRLADALEQVARDQGFVTAWGRCQSADGTPPLWPFQQMLRELAAGAGGRGPAVLASEDPRMSHRPSRL